MAGDGRLSDRALAEYADALLTAARAGLAATGEIVADVLVDAVRVRVRAARGPVAVAVLSDLRTIPAALDRPADVELVAVDRVGAGPPPAPPWPRDAYRPGDELAGVGEAAPIRAAYALTSGLLTVLRRRDGRGVWWAADAAALPDWERCSPMRPLFHWGLEPHGLRLLHGAVVGGPGGGVLLVGPGGSGKSTTALAAFQAGALHLGDDLVPVRLGPPPFAHALYRSAKLTPDGLERLPAFAAHISRAVGPKQLLDLAAIHAERPVAALPLRAIVVPRVTDRATARLRPASAAVGLRALGPSTLFGLPGDREGVLRAAAALVRALPVHTLELGRDLASGPAALAALTGAPTELVPSPT